MPLPTGVVSVPFQPRMPVCKRKQELDIQSAGGKNSSSSKYMKSAWELWSPCAFSAALEVWSPELWEVSFPKSKTPCVV